MKFIVLLLATILVGCTTVSTTKTIAIAPQPGEQQVVVDANAHARCKEILIFMSCKLDLDLQQVSAETSQHAALDASPSNAIALRIEKLDDLKAHKLVTEKEYQEQRKNILRDL